MKSNLNLITGILVTMLVISRLNAQYVAIPDSNFTQKLQQIAPGAMNGNLMDTTHPQIVNCLFIDCNSLGIQNLDGIQYFDALQTLYCSNNQITTIPALPPLLQHFNCYGNLISSLPPLPATLKYLYCSQNQLTTLPSLQNTSLEQLLAGSNQLTSLPDLPTSLTFLGCSQNLLTSLPELPESLYCLECQFSQLTSLPELPSGLVELWCAGNHLTYLPPLPQLHILCCANNDIVCLPVIPSSINFFAGGNLSLAITDGNPLTCIPNETPYFNQLTTGLPLCLPYDLVTNPNGCETPISLYGHVYEDNNATCDQELGESGLRHVPVILKDADSGNIVGEVFSTATGFYNSYIPLDGNYTVFVDTSALSSFAEPTCADSTFAVTTGQAMTHVDLGMRCNGGFDIGVKSACRAQLVFPGLTHRLDIVAGDLSKWYGFHCTQVIPGQLKITLSGPVTYAGSFFGALEPVVNGNVLTYDISDFNTIDIANAFRIHLLTDTTVQIGDTITASISVSTPLAGEQDTTNNTFTLSYIAFNSLDPNTKEVFPMDVLPGYADYFTYTVHFQNIGNAPAMNIRVIDTLDTHLDLSTFEVLNYSHDVKIERIENRLYLRFPEINLVSNTVNEEASQGYFQYRIKPLSNQPAGTVIPNTAYIYFDYNAAVVTNTTENHFLQDLSVTNPVITPVFSVYPNPSEGTFSVQTTKAEPGTQLYVIDVSGKVVFTIAITSENQSIVTELDAGVYLVILENPLSGTLTQQRLVIRK